MIAFIIIVFILFVLALLPMRRGDDIEELRSNAAKRIEEFMSPSLPDCTSEIMDEFKKVPVDNQAYHPFRHNTKIKADAMLLDALIHLLESGEYTIGADLITGMGAQMVIIAKDVNYALLEEKAINFEQYEFLDLQIENAKRPPMFRYLFGDKI